VLGLPLTRRLLTRQRERQIKGYFHRHGFKILVSGRLVPGFRTAAYLTAGILKLPPLRLILTDLVAASLSTMVFFGLAYAFAYQIQQGIREVQQWALVGLAVAIVAWILIRFYRAKRRAGQPIGPPVLEDDLDPLSIDTRPGSQTKQSSPTKTEIKIEPEPEVEPKPEPQVDQPAAPPAIDKYLTESSTHPCAPSSLNQNHDGVALDSPPARAVGEPSAEERLGVRQT
jgi:hypothetical protein